MNKWLVLFLCLLLIILSVSSALLRIVYLNYSIVVVILIVILLVIFGKIKSNYYSYLIYCIALSLVWQTTLMGAWAVGTDVQGEIWCSRRALTTPWNPFESGVINSQSNSSFIVGIVLPLFTYNFGIPIEWVYKIIPPLALAGVPVVLYKAFTYVVGENKAFYSAFFFIIMPVFTLEIGMIAKSMFAELFLAFVILAITSNWKQWTKLLVIIVSLILCILAHYTVGIIAVYFMVVMFGIRLVSLPIKKWIFQNHTIKFSSLLIIFFITVSSLFLYYNKASDGVIIKVVDRVALTYFGIDLIKNEPSIEIVTAKDEGNPTNEKSTNTNDKGKFMEINIAGQPAVVRAGLNMDIASVSIAGQIFRVMQFITQLLIVIGAMWLLFKWKYYNFSLEYMAGIFASFVMLILCILLPYFSSTINMTRFYHMALFFLAPMFVLGIDFLFDYRGDK